MEFFNICGFTFICIIMIPNIIYAIKNKNKSNNKTNKKLEIIEQIGRYGCICFMIINIPYTWFGWWSDEAFGLYFIVDITLLIIYCLIWCICFNKNNIFKALSLSIIPSIIFLFSGIMSRSILLILSALIFTSSHIIISYKNVDK